MSETIHIAVHRDGTIESTIDHGYDMLVGKHSWPAFMFSTRSGTKVRAYAPSDMSSEDVMVAIKKQRDWF